MDSTCANGIVQLNIEDVLASDTPNTEAPDSEPPSPNGRENKNSERCGGKDEERKASKAKFVRPERRHKTSDTSVPMGSKPPTKGKKKISGRKRGLIPQGFFNELNDAIDERLQYTEGEPQVRIAVLDTGIDLNHEDFNKARPRRFTNNLESEPAKEEAPHKVRIKRLRNFCIQEGIDGDNRKIQEQYATDCDGHGTQVAGIILRVAPNAELYIGRVCVGDDDTGSSLKNDAFKDPQPDVVAMAVEWAIKQKVDIINLSLGFKASSRNSFTRLIQALKEAKKHRILVIAAASNDGPLEDELAWPAKDRF
ncbi:subtilisin-like protein [Penicillium herquei]|nr:subtilisin-like protein [Penicillium herquei]